MGLQGFDNAAMHDAGVGGINTADVRTNDVDDTRRQLGQSVGVPGEARGSGSTLCGREAGDEKEEGLRDGGVKEPDVILGAWLNPQVIHASWAICARPRNSSDKGCGLVHAVETEEVGSILLDEVVLLSHALLLDRPTKDEVKDILERRNLVEEEHKGAIQILGNVSVMSEIHTEEEEE